MLTHELRWWIDPSWKWWWRWWSGVASVGEKSQACILLRSNQSLGWDAPCVAACCAVHPSFPSLIHWLTFTSITIVNRMCQVFRHRNAPRALGHMLDHSASLVLVNCASGYHRAPAMSLILWTFLTVTGWQKIHLQIHDDYCWWWSWAGQWIGLSGSWIWCRSVPPIIVTNPWLAASLPAIAQSVWGYWDGFVPCLPSVLPANVCQK